MNSVFLAWTSYNRRSDMLAWHLGAHMHHLAYGQHGNLLQAPLRYLVLALRSWKVLRQERPQMIFIQNPPIFCVLVVWFYCQFYHARYVIDSHTAAFLSPKWRWSLWLHRFLSHGAVTTIVTNTALRDQVQGWGCRASIIGYSPATYPEGEPFPVSGTFNIAVISTGAEDEPIELMFAAAHELPDARFYVTGRSASIPSATLALRPDNCQLTGYLPEAQYIGLLRSVDAVIDLTTRDYTLLLGAFEAVALGTPLITSDWPVLRSYFSEGTIHVPNTVAGIAAGVRRAQREHETLRREMLQLREHLQAEWNRTFAELQLLLSR